MLTVSQLHQVCDYIFGNVACFVSTQRVQKTKTEFSSITTRSKVFSNVLFLKLIIKSYSSHIAQCRHIPVRCEFCDQEFSQLLIPAHQENECTQRWKKTAQNSRNMAEENARLGNEGRKGSRKP